MCNVYFLHYDETDTLSAHKAHRHGRMPPTACPRIARHVPLLTYHESTYPSVAPLALDVLSMPASEAYAERVFSVCGYLSAGSRNRLSKIMERRVFLQMNSNILSSL